MKGLEGESRSLRQDSFPPHSSGKHKQYGFTGGEPGELHPGKRSSSGSPSPYALLGGRGEEVAHG